MGHNFCFVSRIIDAETDKDAERPLKEQKQNNQLPPH
jgi:hypothetical protein